MRELYEVEAWVLWLPVVAAAVFLIVGIVGWWMAFVLNRSNGRANEGWEKSIALNKGLNDRANKAEANAREAEVGHRECARKLEKAENRIDELSLIHSGYKNSSRKIDELEKANARLAENCGNLLRAKLSLEGKLSNLTPKRLKDGKFAPKSGKTGEKKKTSRK